MSETQAGSGGRSAHARMKDESNASFSSFILHPSAFLGGAPGRDLGVQGDRVGVQDQSAKRLDGHQGSRARGTGDAHGGDRAPARDRGRIGRGRKSCDRGIGRLMERPGASSGYGNDSRQNGPLSSRFLRDCAVVRAGFAPALGQLGGPGNGRGAATVDPLRPADAPERSPAVIGVNRTAVRGDPSPRATAAVIEGSKGARSPRPSAHHSMGRTSPQSRTSPRFRVHCSPCRLPSYRCS